MRGRPRIFQSPEAMLELVEQYFDQTDEPTMTGLCVHLSIPKQTLHEYQKREEFADIVKMARQRVEAEVEWQLVYGKGGAGPIFWLKNHSDYVDRVEQQHSGPKGGPIQTIERTIVRADAPSEGS